MKRYVNVPLVVVILSAITGITSSCAHQTRGKAPSLAQSALVYYAPSMKVYVHVVLIEDVKKSKKISSGNVMHHQRKPILLSKRYHDDIIQSERLYEEGKHREAAARLETAYSKEPNNPFISNAYARALYRINDPGKYAVYQQLVKTLDNPDTNTVSFDFSQNKELTRDPHIDRELNELWIELGERVKNKIVLDVWFMEAYWKLGTLHLDNNRYLLGAFEISRALHCGVGSHPLLLEQALGYLTESYYKLGKLHLARAYAEETLRLFPANTYVYKYRATMNKPVPVRVEE